VAAGVAFYGFLAMAPLIASLVLIYGLIVEPEEVVGHVQALGELAPTAAAGVIEELLRNAADAADGKRGLGLVLALALAVFGGMKGAGAIITALNVVYEEQESRGLIRLNLARAAVTVGALALGLCSLLAASLTGVMERLSTDMGVVADLIRIGGWLATAALASAFVAALYRYAPDRDEARWAWLTPGAIVATLGIIGANAGFGLYAANLGKFDATYGSLGAIVALLTWLYFSSYILLLGAELNAELEHQTARDTTEGAEVPMGSRNAVMADTVA
jgi:membrane protein